MGDAREPPYLFTVKRVRGGVLKSGFLDGMGSGENASDHEANGRRSSHLLSEVVSLESGGGGGGPALNVHSRKSFCERHGIYPKNIIIEYTRRVD